MPTPEAPVTASMILPLVLASSKYLGLRRVTFGFRPCLLWKFATSCQPRNGDSPDCVLMIEGRLGRNCPNYRRWSWLAVSRLAFPPSFQPHHHINHIIMTNVRKRLNSLVKTLSGTKPCVFSGNVAPGSGGRRGRVSVSLDLEKWPAKCAPDCSESSVFHIKNVKKRNVIESPLSALHARWPIWCKRNGTAACNKAWVMLRRSWQVGLQLRLHTRCNSCAKCSS